MLPAPSIREIVGAHAALRREHVLSTETKRAVAGDRGDDARSEIDLPNSPVVIVDDEKIALPIQSHVPRAGHLCGRSRPPIAAETASPGSGNRADDPCRCDTANSMVPAVGKVDVPCGILSNADRIAKRYGRGLFTVTKAVSPGYGRKNVGLSPSGSGEAGEKKSSELKAHG